MYQYPTFSDTQRLAPLSDFQHLGHFFYFRFRGNEFPCIGTQKSLAEFHLEDLGFGKGSGDTTHRLFNFTVLFRGERGEWGGGHSVFVACSHYCGWDCGGCLGRTNVCCNRKGFVLRPSLAWWEAKSKYTRAGVASCRQRVVFSFTDRGIMMICGVDVTNIDVG